MYPVPPLMKILGLAEEFIIFPHMAGHRFAPYDPTLSLHPNR
jgi:hypothetical protein